ncbi:hypothetical protein CBL_00126 [Carabus blaptoides fortunei]
MASNDRLMHSESSGLVEWRRMCAVMSLGHLVSPCAPLYLVSAALAMIPQAPVKVHMSYSRTCQETRLAYKEPVLTVGRGGLAAVLPGLGGMLVLLLQEPEIGNLAPVV